MVFSRFQSMQPVVRTGRRFAVVLSWGRTSVRPLVVLFLIVLFLIAFVCPVSTRAETPIAIARSPATDLALAQRFDETDEQLLNQIEKGCFQFFWRETGQASGLAKDRRFASVASLAGIGFQLAAMPIGVERGWITREQGMARSENIVKTLMQRDDNRKFGVFLHFVDLETGGLLPGKQSEQASTVDHALFLAGALTAAEYFGGDLATRVDQIASETNWRAFDVSEKGFITFGWRPSEGSLNGPGDFRPWDWHLASDEERLVYFLAVGAPRDEFAGDPRDYYRLERLVKQHADMPPFVVSWNGSMFTYFFSHCWIDYRRFGVDAPSAFGIDQPVVDWVENGRRAALTHRNRCIDAAGKFRTFAEHRWGLAPCMGLHEDGRLGYLVQGIRPSVMDADQWDGGTVAPYAAGSAILFTPEESMAALRAFRALQTAKGEPLVWRDPDDGGYGFADSFNLDFDAACDDNVAIDVGPMLLAIENVRSGLIWRLFMQHHVARRAVERLQLAPYVGR